ncbi:hypothetical protein B0H11DRAFT_1944003 [Mycena galericulata]|nr:hypothetical protein B0H11DRAFT_1944003 [Mycena galericulata]
MPHQPTPAVTLLTEIHDAFGTPFVQAISNTTLVLITIIQNVKRNKDECIQLMESIYQVLYGIVNLHIVSETAGSLPPTVLNDLGKFTEYDSNLATLKYMMHTFVEAQQDGNKIKNFFRQTEMNTLLKECQAGVKHALEVFKASPEMFKLESGASNLVNMREMQNTADNMHRDLLEMISTLSDGMHQTFNGSQIRARWYGQNNLAKAALHHPNITAKYANRFFVPCDSATTGVDIAALIGAHLGLKPAKNPVKPMIECLAKKTDCLLILDNLETPWEPIASRPGVEELLSLLTGLPHIALITTMRGTERPGKRNVLDIADVYEAQEIDQILYLTDNMPLAVDLIAHLVDYDGDDKNRLKSLVPIREHMQYFRPVASSLVQPLQEHFHKLLNLYQIYRGSLQATSRIAQITLNLGNLHQILLRGLQSKDSGLADTIDCTLSLNSFSRLAGYGPLALMDQIPIVLPQPSNHRLEVEYIIEVLRSQLYQSVADPEMLISQAISHFQHFNDPIVKCQVAKGMEFLDTSLRLAKSTSETREQTRF